MTCFTADALPDDRYLDHSTDHDALVFKDDGLTIVLINPVDNPYEAGLFVGLTRGQALCLAVRIVVTALFRR